MQPTLVTNQFNDLQQRADSDISIMFGAVAILFLVAAVTAVYVILSGKKQK